MSNDNGWSLAGPSSRPRAASSLAVGQRCRKLGTVAQLGVVRFVGELDGRAGRWAGVEWDDLGLGDTCGELDGRRYFKCSLRGERTGNAASFLRESEVFVQGASGTVLTGQWPHRRRREHDAS
jgi:dynactin complex subunit